MLNYTSHQFFMEQAILESEKARLLSPPNPWVGCVIVKNNKIIGKGFTQKIGEPHAEIQALNLAQESVKDASLYVTLEPCSHYGRTPPCTHAIIQSGIKEVFIGIEDPDPRVQGKGIANLKKAGINVQIGFCADKIKKSLAPYLHHRLTSLPFTILKTGMSIDGRTAAADGSSQWITCQEARQDVHAYRAHSQAIVIGANTALKDSPQLTVRHPDYPLIKQPLRVILDSQGKTPSIGPLFDCSIAPTLVVTTHQTDSKRIHEWEKAGAEILFVSPSKDSTGVDLYETWMHLGKKSILQAFVEGGSILHSSLLKTNLFQQLLIYMGPLLIGSQGQPFFTHSGSSLKESQKMHLEEILKIGDSVRLLYKPSS